MLSATNKGIDNPMDYDYTWPMLLFATLGALALVFGIWLKILDSRNNYGLEKPNMPSDLEKVEFDGEE